MKIEIKTTSDFIFVDVKLPHFNTKDLKKATHVRINPQEMLDLLLEKGYTPGEMVAGNTLRNHRPGKESGFFIFKNNKVIPNALKEIPKESAPVKRTRRAKKVKRVTSES